MSLTPDFIRFLFVKCASRQARVSLSSITWQSNCPLIYCIIAIPFLLIAGYLSYSYSVDAYARHTLKKAAPDFKKVVPLHPIMFQFTREEAESSRSQFAMLNDDSISSQNARTSRSSEDLKSQIVTSSGEENMSPQIATTSPQRRPASALPYAFTENGIAMLSSVLRSSHR